MNCILQAQFAVWNRPIAVHGFVSQGFAKSDANNYLTMKTSGGTFGFTDGGINLVAQLSGRLRVGAQIYVRNIGTLGDYHPTIDWALADYRIADQLGVRGGKVKTIYGLYTDTQDMEALHTWAILPQAIYPLDLRSSSIAHLGGDVYGEVSLPKRGSIAYTAYAGRRFDDKYGGTRGVTLQSGTRLDSITGWLAGGDLRWNNPLPGVTMGGSWMAMSFRGRGEFIAYQVPTASDTDVKAGILYLDYQRHRLHLTAEYNRQTSFTVVQGVPGLSEVRQHALGWYASAAYRLLPKLEVGVYHSRFVSDSRRDWAAPSNHIYDQVFTARYTLTSRWSVKAEGHFIDGYGSRYSAHGFYLAQNPNGYQRRTNLLILRAGYTF